MRDLAIPAVERNATVFDRLMATDAVISGLQAPSVPCYSPALCRGSVRLSSRLVVVGQRVLQRLPGGVASVVDRLLDAV